MNFLQSLTRRAEGSMTVVERPLIPFVNAFPVGLVETPMPRRDESLRSPMGSASSDRAVVPAPPPPIAAPGQPAPADKPAHPIIDAPRPQSTKSVSDTPPAMPSQVPSRPPADAVIHQRVVERSVVQPWQKPEAKPLPSAVALPPRTVERIVERNHEVVRERSERVIERVPEVRKARYVPTQTVTPSQSPRRPVGVGVVVPPPRGESHTVQATPPTVLASAPPPPQINVSIGNVIVRVQPPVAPVQRSESVRPAPPTLSLDAYTAARRGDRR